MPVVAAERMTSDGPRARLRAVTVCAVVGALLSGCASGSDEPAWTPPPQPEPAPIAEDGLPQDVAGDAARWVLERIAEPVGTPVPEPEARFTPMFLGQLPPERLATVLDRMRARGPWQVAAVQSIGARLSVPLVAGTRAYEMRLTVDDAGLIERLAFVEAAPPRAEATSWEELAAEASGLPGRSSVYVATVADDGTCVPVDGLPAGSAAGEVLPMATMVQLFVLLATVDAIGAGELSWDDEVMVLNRLRSLPPGNLYNAESELEVTVRNLAGSMVALNDHTAMDLLVSAVGRDRVERVFAEMGLGVNIPFASSRDLFHIGWGPDAAELRPEWSVATEARRRQILASELPTGWPAVDRTALSEIPGWPYGVDWFASAADLCRVHVALDQRADTPHGEPIREILSRNPGVARNVAQDPGAASPEDWSYIAFRGGASTGTMGGAWYAEPAEGAAQDRPVVVVVQSASEQPQGALHISTMVGIAQDALRLAAG